jgi:Ca-activated chloride channel family protein
MRVHIGTSIVLAGLLAAVLAAQTPAAGMLTGTVSNEAGTRLSGVVVTARGPAPRVELRSATTDARGGFSIVNLPAGSYRLEFIREGFRTHVREQVTVAAGGTRTLTVAMVAGATADIVIGPADSAKAVPPLPPPPPPVRVGGNMGSGAGRGGTVEGGIPGGVPGGLPNASASQPGVDYDRSVARRLESVSAYAPSSPAYPRSGHESYASIDENPFRRVTDEPLSTFSIDTDTASYANVRRFLSAGQLPPRDAVRIEELINYFRFEYPNPRGEAPFSITTELAEAPWNPAHRIALVGLKGRVPEEREVPARNLVFLLDVSGSMQPPERLPLIRNAMRMLVDVLRPQDRVAIVVYASASGLVLPSTPGSNKTTIHDAIARLEAGGSTNGGAGVRLAYEVARQNFMPGGINRVILATDGDFNVGVTSQKDLLTLIETERKSGVFLSVLGVGSGNLKDATMELLADKGNGNYSYLDSLQEARKVLVHEAGATLHTIAKDVKIQVEFNPSHVAAYRLIGYENRILNKEDFNDDRKDAGEIGAGHTVTALYEIVPPGVSWQGSVDPLKYQQVPQPPPARTAAAASNELVTVKLRYKAPDGDVSRLLSAVIQNTPRALTPNLGFASAVAEFGMLLRDSPYKGQAAYDALQRRAKQFRGEDAEGYRAEFIRLADLAAGLQQVRTPVRNTITK